MSVMELGHLLTRSGLTYLEVSSEVCHDSFCQLGNSVSLSWAVCHEAFCLHVVSSSSCIPVLYLEPVLFLIPLQCVNLFCNLPKCILLFFSYISSLRRFFAKYSPHRKKDRQRVYNVTLRRVRMTITAVEKYCALHILSVYL